MGYVSGSADAPRPPMLRVARSLYRRWERLSRIDRDRLEPVAAAVKEAALELRGHNDSRIAEGELRHANEQLAIAIADRLEADPDLGPAEVEELRAELRHELGRADAPSRRAA